MAEPIGGQLGRRQFLIAGGAAAVLFGASAARARPVAADPAVTGSWTKPFGLTLVSIHAVMLHTGSVLLFSWPNKTVGSDAVLWHPASGKITNIALSYQRDIFCSGMSVLPDGRVFIAGGHLYQGVFGGGVANTTIFDPAANSWTEGPLMSQPRWYPTTAQLGDGSVMIFGGLARPTAQATTVDRYQPASDSMHTAPASASKAMLTYPRMKLTTGGLLAWTNLASTQFFHPATSTWRTGPALNPGGRGRNDTSCCCPGSPGSWRSAGRPRQVRRPLRDPRYGGHPAGLEGHWPDASSPGVGQYRAAARRHGAGGRRRPEGRLRRAGLQCRDLPPGLRDLDRDGRPAGAADVSLDCGAAAGRPGAVRRGELRQPEADRRDLLPALPVQGRPRQSPAPRPRWATATRSPSAPRTRPASNGWRWSRRPR